MGKGNNGGLHAFGFAGAGQRWEEFQSSRIIGELIRYTQFFARDPLLCLAIFCFVVSVSAKVSTSGQPILSTAKLFVVLQVKLRILASHTSSQFNSISDYHKRVLTKTLMVSSSVSLIQCENNKRETRGGTNIVAVLLTGSLV